MIRLYIEAPFAKAQLLPLSPQQTHYLLHVMRKKKGDVLLVFNGQDGEWQAAIEETHKKSCLIRLTHQQQIQQIDSDTWVLFSLLKSRAQDFLIEKSTELGISRLQPILTHRTVVHKTNLIKLKAQAIEAAEQCGRLTIPFIREPQTLEHCLSSWPQDRLLVFGDESRSSPSWTKFAKEIKQDQKLAFLTGPEGGFTQEELLQLKSHKMARGVTLGPNILRAETASLVGLSLIEEFKRAKVL